jgi:hypothetical protein
MGGHVELAQENGFRRTRAIGQAVMGDGLPSGIRRGLVCGLLVFCVASRATDFAQSSHVDDWLRHPVYGDPSFDSFERRPGNPIHLGLPPYEWPVNGFLFDDPVSKAWFVYVGDYGRGYMTPPSRCLLFRSNDSGKTWVDLGVVLHGDPKMFDHGGHTPDVSVVYAEGRYHMVYDWGQLDFNQEGGLAYAWADRPEGPWHRALQPITRNSTLSKLDGRYQRTYAATLIRRSHDWLILGMMDSAPSSWALFAMTAVKPDGPYGERHIVRQVESNYYHPPLMEFFPAFTVGAWVYAPATSVALNRDFNALYRAPLEDADKPNAWTIDRNGSVWHSEDREEEFFGIWGQTFSGFVDGRGQLHAMFPSRDSQGRGTINLAERRFDRPLRTSGFILNGHQGPALTLLRQAYDDLSLKMAFTVRGAMSLLLDYAAPLGPNAPSSDATLHRLMSTRHVALEIGQSHWSLHQHGIGSEDQILGAGERRILEHGSLELTRRGDLLEVRLDGKMIWKGELKAIGGLKSSGVLGLRVEAKSRLEVEKFEAGGNPRPASMAFLWTEALLGAGERSADWNEIANENFHYGGGVVSKSPTARVKWNVAGSGVRLWAPRGPAYGMATLLVDGKSVASVDFHAEHDEISQPLWTGSNIADGCHTVVLRGSEGRIPVDFLEVISGHARR